MTLVPVHVVVPPPDRSAPGGVLHLIAVPSVGDRLTLPEFAGIFEVIAVRVRRREGNYVIVARRVQEEDNEVPETPIGTPDGTR